MLALKPKNGWKWLFWLSIMIQTPLIGFLAYQALDTGIGYTYQMDECARTDKKLAILSKLYPTGEKKKDILVRLRTQNPKGFIVEKKNYLEMDGLRFSFDVNGNLGKINAHSDSEPSDD